MNSESTLKIASCGHAVTFLPMQEEGETKAAGPTLPLVPSALVTLMEASHRQNLYTVPMGFMQRN